MADIREVIARALYGCEWNAEKWPESEMQDAFLLRADAILSAIEAAGMRIVPEEPTPKMIANGERAVDAAINDLTDSFIKDVQGSAAAYRAMLAATPQE